MKIINDGHWRLELRRTIHGHIYMGISNSPIAEKMIQALSFMSYSGQIFQVPLARILLSTVSLGKGYILIVHVSDIIVFLYIG